MTTDWTIPEPGLAKRCVDTIRMLSIDAVEKANSGHPGVCLGAADAAFVLWSRFLRFDPSKPDWPDRDRFILSPGHASMLIYSLLHLAGYGIDLEEIRNFRQRGSRTAGHPEYGLAPGVEVTTGPLGQGFAHGVGMALAGRMMAARFNREGHSPVGFRVFGLCGDGDLMEGISYEAASMAGHLGLGNIVYLFDSNAITIEGGTGLAFSEDVRMRFEAMGWHVARADGYDHEAVAAALEEGVAALDRPSLIIASTEIGHGAPNVHGSCSTHGAPLGPDEVRATKEASGWPLEPAFHVPDDVREWFDGLARAGRARRESWERSFDRYRDACPDLAEGWGRAFDRSKVPRDLFEKIMAGVEPSAGKATRVLSGKAIAAASEVVGNLAGGSADLGPSNKTEIPGAAYLDPLAGTAGFAGANMHFGIREHAMAAVVNGMTLHGAFRAYGGTFLVFADYMKPALRLASLMEIPSIFVFTHDSFAVGEDGPTHQPVEHLWMLRSIPGMKVFRPADAAETAAAWAFAIRNTGGPVCLVMTRQGVPAFERAGGAKEADLLKGACVVSDPGGRDPDIVMVATGSEVAASVEAAGILARSGVRARVVSMPCMELFDQQNEEYRLSVIPAGTRVVTVEAGSTVGWHRFAGSDGLVIGLDRFGASAPASSLAEEFGFTPEKIARRVSGWL